MSDFTKVPTTREVYVAIRSEHELDLFASFSDPDGTFNGGPGEVGRMETGYGLKGTDFPLLWIRTTWQITPSGKRADEWHDYWLCVGKKEE